MAEPRMFRAFVAPNPVTGEDTDYRVFSTENKPRNQEDFAGAISTWVEHKETPPGFTVLPKGSSQEAIRSGFERYIGGPVRAAAEAVRSSPDTPPIPGLGVVGQGVSGAANLLKNTVVPGVLESVSTPEDLVGTLGTAASAYATRGMTAIPAAIRTGIGGAVSYALGDWIASSKKGIPQAIVYGGMQAAARGLQGVAEWLGSKAGFGSSVGEAVQEGAYKKMLKLAQKEHPHLANDPNLLRFTESDPRLFPQYMRIMGEEMREQTRLITSGTDDALRAAARLDPASRFKPGELTTLAAQVKRLGNASANVIDSVNDPRAYGKALNSLNATRQNILDLFEQRFPGNVDVLDAATYALNDHLDLLKRGVGPAHFVRMLEESGQGGGFNPGKLQKATQDWFKANPSEAVQQAGEIAQGTIGQPSRLGVSARIPLPFTGGMSVPLSTQVGMRYNPSGIPGAAAVVGTMAGRTALPQPGSVTVTDIQPNIPGALQKGSQAMESFTGGKR